MDKKLLLIAGLLLMISACSSMNQNSNSTTTANYGQDNAQIKLTEAADSVSNSLAQLAAIEKANTPRAKLPPLPNPASIGMANLASVDWSGPIEPLVRKLAAASNYKVRVLGRNPAIPVIVSVSAANVPIADILRDASLQAEKQADILIYPSQKMIELRYLR